MYANAFHRNFLDQWAFMAQGDIRISIPLWHGWPSGCEYMTEDPEI